MRRNRSWATTTAIGLAAAVLVSGCQAPGGNAAPGPTTPVRADLAALAVAPEDSAAGYDRAQWPHWSQGGGGCDARENALKTQGRNVTTGKDCKVTSGEWTSSYDGLVITDPGKLDIDHLVPLAEVVRSGTRQWSKADRERYANDPAILVVALAASNRAKGDHDPAEWLPALDRCGYANRWIQTKQRYHLTVDQRERDALLQIQAVCLSK